MTFGARPAAPSREVLDRYYPRVLGFAYQVLGDAELAAQAAEHAFLQPQPPATELAVWKATMTTLRIYVGRGFVVRPLGPLLQGWQADLLQGLACLAPLERALLLLRYHEGLAPRILSEVLDLPEAEVRAQLARARATLIERIGGS